MPGIAIFGGVYCGADKIVDDLVAASGIRLITDQELIEKAADVSGIPVKKIRCAFSANTSVFNPFTHEKEFSIASLRVALARELSTAPLLVHGFCSLLIPRSIRDIHRVCIAAPTSYRIIYAQTKSATDEQSALQQIRADDVDSAAWAEFLYGINDPWDPSLYDIVLSMHQTDREKAAALIKAHNENGAESSGDTLYQALDDFALSATVEMTLYRAGHDVSVSADRGQVVLTIGKQVLNRSLLEKDLCDLAGAVTGVQSVAVIQERMNPSPQIYYRFSMEHPSRVLLVDDEQEFVKTLSERLQLRDMGSAVAFDGETALEMVREDPPEVMVLDLKMPKMDGMSVLALTKEMRPAIEVIILTGHGDESDRKRCMAQGAFAYLQKPVDMEILSDTIKKAHEKNRTDDP